MCVLAQVPAIWHPFSSKLAASLFSEKLVIRGGADRSVKEVSEAPGPQASLWKVPVVLEACSVSSVVIYLSSREC